MNAASLSALSALAGSVIGGLTSFSTSWLVQQNSARTQTRFQERTKRETSYGSFIEEASLRFGEALESAEGRLETS